MGCPEPKTRTEILAKLSEINQKLHDLNIEIQPNTHTDLVRTKHVLRWVLSIDKEL